MLPAPYDLALYRGDTLRLQFALWSDAGRTQPTDLTGVTALSQIRDKPDGKTVVELTCTITAPNIIDLYLDADDAEALPKKGAWDLQLTWPSGDVLSPVAGKVTVTADVTIPLNGSP
jgi:hypothetical protein